MCSNSSSKGEPLQCAVKGSQMDIQNLNLIRDMLDDSPQDSTDENEAQTQQKAVRTSHQG